jgi:isoleucyl-tRNA synthetase
MSAVFLLIIFLVAAWGMEQTSKLKKVENEYIKLSNKYEYKSQLLRDFTSKEINSDIKELRRIDRLYSSKLDIIDRSVDEELYK